MQKFGRHPMFLMDAASDAALAAARKLVADADAAAGGGNGNGSVVIAGKSYTQEEANKLFSERAQQAKQAERTALLAELGVTDVEAVKAKLKAADEAAAAGLSDLEKARKEATDAAKKATDAEADRNAALARADEKLLRAAVMSAATAQGVDDAELKSLWLLLKNDAGLRGKIKAKADGDDEFDGVEDVVKEMVKAHPKWLKTEHLAPDINARNRGGPSDAALKEASEAQGRQLRNRF